MCCMGSGERLPCWGDVYLVSQHECKSVKCDCAWIPWDVLLQGAKEQAGVKKALCFLLLRVRGGKAHSF